MGWLRRMLAGVMSASTTHERNEPVRAAGMITLAGDGSFSHEVVGESFYQDALNDLCGGKCEDGHEMECLAILRPEPDNPYDSNAVAILIRGRKVAHLDRESAKRFNGEMRAMGATQGCCRALVNGGWYRPGRRGQADEGHYGVELDLVWPLRRLEQ